MDNQSKQSQSSNCQPAIAAAFTACLLLTAFNTFAQSPFSIDGTVPDVDCCYEFADPVGSVSELGPVNSSDTKLGTINSATEPMLGFTNPNSSTDIGTIWLDTAKDADGDIWLYFAWERDAASGSSAISYESLETRHPVHRACRF